MSKKQVTKTGGSWLSKITKAEQIYLDSIQVTPKLIGIQGAIEVGVNNEYIGEIFSFFNILCSICRKGGESVLGQTWQVFWYTDTLGLIVS